MCPPQCPPQIDSRLDRERDSELVRALQDVLKDETFQFDSKPAREARGAAVLLLEWSTKEENMLAVNNFLTSLHKYFDKSLQCINPCSVNRVRLWRSFYILRSSEEFSKFWSDFLKAAGAKQTPTLYQHLTTLLFNEKISQTVKTESLSPYDAGPLTENEGNTVRYIAGYTCRSLREKLERGSHELKEELILCLMELTTRKSTSSPSKGNLHEEWTIRVDRGGLWYVKNTTYLFFVAVEEELRKCLKMLLKGLAHRSAIVKNIVECEEVQFYWLITQADFDVGDDETYQILLHKIVEAYITIRGNSYASNLMEKHKQATTKGTQRSKAFRNELYNEND